MGFGTRDSGFETTNSDLTRRIPNPESRIPRLNAIADCDCAVRAGWTLVDLASAFLDGGARLIQVRAKTLSPSALLEAVDAVVARARGSGAAIIVNDRADVAAAAGAAGVHVGQDDLAPALVRRVVGAAAIVGRSTHTPEQVGRALAEPITYLAIGPVFGTPTKATGYAPIGLDAVRAAALSAAPRGIPVMAIGGITLETAPDVVAAGASSVAVIADLLVGNDPARRVRAFLDRLDREP
jgi:thiamine-phosphate pyrophosphorylase